MSGVLREEMAAGRLSLADYQARLTRVRAARTVGELDAVLRDLPGRRTAGDDEDRPSGGGTAGEGPAGEPSPPRATRGGCAGVLLVSVVAACAVRSAARFPIFRVRAVD